MLGFRPKSDKVCKSQRWSDCTYARASPVSLSRKPLRPVPEVASKTGLSLSRSLVHRQTWRLTGSYLSHWRLANRIRKKERIKRNKISVWSLVVPIYFFVWHFFRPRFFVYVSFSSGRFCLALSSFIYCFIYNISRAEMSQAGLRSKPRAEPWAEPRASSRAGLPSWAEPSPEPMPSTKSSKWAELNPEPSQVESRVPRPQSIPSWAPNWAPSRALSSAEPSIELILRAPSRAPSRARSKAEVG